MVVLGPGAFDPVEGQEDVAGDTSDVLATARSQFTRALATDGISPSVRRNAELGLRQVAVAERALAGGTDTVPDEGRLSPVIQGVFSTLAVINQGLGGVAGLVNETADIFREDESFSLNDLFEDVTGVRAEGKSTLNKVLIGLQAPSPAPAYFQDGIQFEQRDISLQGSFADVVRDIPGESSLGAVTRGTTGFGLDLVLDPLNYLTLGTGLVATGPKSAVNAGARSVGRRVITNGVNKKVVANEILQEARRLQTAGNPEGLIRARRLETIAQAVEGPGGVARARRTLDQEIANILSEYAETGLGARVPFRSNRERLRALVDGSGREAPGALVLREELDNFATTGVGVRVPFTRSINRARAGREAVDAGADSAGVRAARSEAVEGLGNAVRVPTGRIVGKLTDYVIESGSLVTEPLRRVVPSSRLLSKSQQSGDVEGFVGTRLANSVTGTERVFASRIVDELNQRFIDVVPGLELNSNKQFVRGSRQAAREFNSFGEALREGIEDGVESVTLGGKAYELAPFRAFFAEARDLLRQAGVAVGEVENFYPRVLDETEIQDFRRLTGTAEKKQFVRQRKWAPGTLFGFDEAGAAVILKDGSLKEIEAASELIGENFTNPFRNDTLGLVQSYVEGVGYMIERNLIRERLSALGILKSADHFNGMANTRYIQSLIEMRVFDGETGEAIERLIGSNKRQQALEYTDDLIKSSVDRLEKVKIARRNSILGNDAEIDILKERLSETGRQAKVSIGRQRARQAIASIDQLAAVTEEYNLALSTIEDLEEFKVILTSEGSPANLASEIARVDSQLEDFTRKAAELEPKLETQGMTTAAFVEVADSTELDEYFDAALEIADLRAGGARRRTPANFVMENIASSLQIHNRLLKSKNARIRLIEDNSIRATVMKKISEGRLSEVRDTIRDLVKSGDVTAADAELLEPALTLVNDLVVMDRLTMQSLRANREEVSRFYRNRSEELYDQAQLGGRNGREKVKAEHLFQASRLAEVGADLMDEANDFYRRAQEIEDIPGLDPADAAAARKHLDINAKTRMVYAQEAFTLAELANIGTPFNGDRLLKTLENMTVRDFERVTTLMERDAMKSLVRIEGTGDLTLSNEIAEIVDWRVQMNSGIQNRLLKTTRALRRAFNPAALLSPSFHNRNLMSAAHMNGVIAGLWNPADYRRYKKWLTGARRQVAGDTDPWRGLNMSEQDQEIATLLYSRLEAQQGRVSDGLDRLQDRGQRTFASLEGTPLSQASQNFRDAFYVNVSNASNFFEKTIASGGFRPYRQARGTLEDAADVGIEEWMRFSLGAHVMSDGRSLDSAIDLINKAHFDYSDLSNFDRIMRDSMFPFWTFMSRNLPLQMEMLVKRPQAFNNLVAWQEQTYERNDSGGPNPGYRLDSLHFSIPAELWMVNGDLNVPPLFDTFAPGLAFDDLLGRANDLGNVVDSGGFLNIGAPDPRAVFTTILGETSPWTKVWFELATERDVFTRRELRGLEAPITNSLGFDIPGVDTGRDGPMTEVVGALLSMIGWASHEPIDRNPNNRQWRFDAQANQVLRSFLPLMSRVEGLNPGEDSRLRDRRRAAVLSFIYGGIRRNDTDRDRLSAAHELSDEAEAILDQLELYAVPTKKELGAGTSSSVGSLE